MKSEFKFSCFTFSVVALMLSSCGNSGDNHKALSNDSTTSNSITSLDREREHPEIFLKLKGKILGSKADITLKNTAEKTNYTKINLGIYFLTKQNLQVDSGTYLCYSRLMPGDSVRFHLTEKMRRGSDRFRVEVKSAEVFE